MTEERRCLLGVFSHPDDESFGVAGIIHRYRREGVRTVLVCVTRGEVGDIGDPSLATPETLGAVREAEMREAAAIMGVEDLIFLDYRDGTLPGVPESEAAGKLVRIIREVRPQVVITFDEKGGYGHPDHVATYRWTAEAFRQAGDPACYPEQMTEGLAPYAPRKLYASVFTTEVLRAVQEKIGDQFDPGGDMATLPIDEMGVPDEEVTIAIALTDEEYQAKLRALHAHRTQTGTTDRYDAVPDDLRREMLGVERFILLEPKEAAGREVGMDLFAEPVT